MTRKIKISRMVFYLIFSIIVTFSVGFACFWIGLEYQEYKREVFRIQHHYVDINKSAIKKEVQSIISYIDYRKQSVRASVEKGLKSKVHEACTVAMEMYNKYHLSMSSADLKDLIKAYLNSSRYDDGKGYFFTFSPAGVIEAHPDTVLLGRTSADLKDGQGAVVPRELIKTAEKSGEGLAAYEWFKPGQSGGRFQKISYVKRFEPFDWIIGAGEYLDMLENELQKEVLEWLNLKRSEDSYIAAFTFDGVRIAHYRKEELGLNFYDYVDPNGVKVVQEVIRAAGEGGGFVEHIASARPTTGKPARKISYCMEAPGWDWVVCAGVYLDEVDALVAVKRDELSRSISRSIVYIIVLFALVTGGLLTALSYFSRRMNASIQAFSSFFDRAAKESTLIDAGKLNFHEFHRLAISANRMVRERQSAEEDLRASEARYRAVVEDQEELICRFLPDMTIIFVNDAYCRFFDEPCENLLGRSFLEYVHEADLEALNNQIASLAPQTPVGSAELRIWNREGKTEWLQWTHRAVFGNGYLIEYQAVGRNITKRKRAEDALQESERRFREMLEKVKLAAMILDTEGNVIYCNDFLGDILGWPRDEIIGHNWFDFTTPDIRARLQSGYVDKIISGDIPSCYENEICTKSGERRLIAWNNTFLRDFEGNVIGGTSIGEDITERKHAEEALQELMRFQQQMIDTLPIPVFYKDREGRYIGCNNAFESFIGKSRCEIVGKSVYELAPAELADLYAEKDADLFSNPGCQVYESVVERPDNSECTVIFHKATFPGPDGSIGGLIGAIIDISERKHAEEERMRLVTAIEQSAEAVFITDTDWTIRYVNPAFEAQSGYNRNEIIGNPTSILKSDRHDRGFFEKIRENLLRGEVWSGRLINRKKDGRTYEAEVKASPVRDSSGKIINYVSIHRDITTEVRLEKELRQAQKMEAIGTLAGGIAHDFNNILTAIIGYSEIAKSKIDEGTPLSRNLDQVLKAATRARDLVKQILTFSRQAEQELRPVQVAPIVEEALKLLRSSLPSTIEIRKSIELKSEEGVVLSDSTQIHQVMMNLCANAAHAMRKRGGVLDVTLSETDITAGQKSLVTALDLEPGRYVRTTISDSGHGMDAAVLERIFDPYFTTKEPGEGTGMGLAVVQGIVRKHGGAVAVHSELGTGTTFDVYLPRVEEETMSPVAEAAEQSPVGSERILFVDDEKGLADLGKEMLESLGYKVTARTSSPDAFDAFRAAPLSFDLVITDMTMPVMTGIDLAKKMTSIRPGIPIILCTGFSEALMGKQTRACGICEILLKPYAITTLAKTIRTTLASSASGGSTQQPDLQAGK
ncbi:MAG: cache domain-containing protein [Syntrophobacteraceae bacterium]